MGLTQNKKNVGCPKCFRNCDGKYCDLHRQELRQLNVSLKPTKSLYYKCKQVDHEIQPYNDIIPISTFDAEYYLNTDGALMSEWNLWLETMECEKCKGCENWEEIDKVRQIYNSPKALKSIGYEVPWYKSKILWIIILIIFAIYFGYTLGQPNTGGSSEESIRQCKNWGGEPALRSDGTYFDCMLNGRPMGE